MSDNEISSALPQEDNQGELRDRIAEPERALETQPDTTLERRRAEEALRESEEKAGAIIESAMDAVIVIDNNGRITHWNRSAEKIFGHAAGDVLGREVHAVIAPPMYHAAYAEGFAEFRKHGKGAAVGKTFQFSAVRSDGTEFPIELSLSSFRIKGLWQAAAIIRDITERWEMQQSVYEQKIFAESLIENSAVATFVLDRSHRVVFWNRACEELTGVSSSDIVGTDEQWRPFYEFKRPTLADVLIEGDFGKLSLLYIKHALSALRPDSRQAEGWYADLNGKRRYILFDASPIYNSKGELTHVIETLQDITLRKQAEEELDRYRSRLEDLVGERTAELINVNRELGTDIAMRKQTEEALRLSEARFKEAQKVARIGIWEWNIETDDIYWSDEVYRIFGVEPGSEVRGKDGMLAYAHPEDRELLDKTMAHALKKNEVCSIEVRIVRPDGVEGHAHYQGRVYYDGAGNPVMMLGSVQDITNRKRMEDEVLRIQKLESIGVLAGGIAHDFNNLLSAILGNISLAKIFAGKDSKVVERLIEAEKVSLHAAGLSKQLLTFSKGGEPVTQVSSLSGIVADAARFALMGSNVQCVITGDDDLRTAEVDEGQIVQVINNIERG